MKVQKPRSLLSTPIRIFIIVFLIILAGAAFYFWPNRLNGFFEDKLINDTNTKTIRIDETVTIDTINYTINTLDLGDNYSTLCFDADGMSIVPPIKGAKLYQGGQLLPYITTVSATCSNSAICFAPTDEYTNLELHIDTIDYLKETSAKYPLEFNAAKSTIDVDILGTQATVTVVLTKDGHQISSEGLEMLSQKKEYGNAMPLEYTLMINGNEDGDFCIDYPPTHIEITIKESVYTGYTIIIPIS